MYVMDVPRSNTSVFLCDDLVWGGSIGKVWHLVGAGKYLMNENGSKSSSVLLKLVIKDFGVGSDSIKAFFEGDVEPFDVVALDFGIDGARFEDDGIFFESGIEEALDLERECGCFAFGFDLSSISNSAISQVKIRRKH